MSSRTGATIFALGCLVSVAAVPESFMRRTLLSRFPSFRKRKDVLDDGDLIVKGNDRWKTRFWRYLASSTVDNHECELVVVNKATETVLFCWVSHDGTLKHFYPISDGSIRDGSVSNTHREWTETNHVFVCIRHDTGPYPVHVSDIDPEV